MIVSLLNSKKRGGRGGEGLFRETEWDGGSEGKSEKFKSTKLVYM